MTRLHACLLAPYQPPHRSEGWQMNLCPQMSGCESLCVLQYVVEAFLKLAQVSSSDTLIDVGCNDGELQL